MEILKALREFELDFCVSTYANKYEATYWEYLVHPPGSAYPVVTIGEEEGIKALRMTVQYAEDEPVSDVPYDYDIFLALESIYGVARGSLDN